MENRDGRLSYMYTNKRKFIRITRLVRVEHDLHLELKMVASSQSTSISELIEEICHKSNYFRRLRSGLQAVLAGHRGTDRYTKVDSEEQAIEMDLGPK